MQIIVNHLTRMQPGYICVAGIDVATGAHVRPAARGRLERRLLARYRGPFDIGHLVDLGKTDPVGRPPEVEDQRIELGRLRYQHTLRADEFWEHLQRTAKPRLSDIFGPELTQSGRGCVLAEGHGQASLGCLRPLGKPLLSLQTRANRPDQVRLRVADGQFDVEVSIMDIRLYNDADYSPNRERIAQIAARLTQTSDIILSVGLTRLFTFDPDRAPVHWLQVNNIHFADDPIWQHKG